LPRRHAHILLRQLRLLPRHPRLQLHIGWRPHRANDRQVVAVQPMSGQVLSQPVRSRDNIIIQKEDNLALGNGHPPIACGRRTTLRLDKEM